MSSLTSLKEMPVLPGAVPGADESSVSGPASELLDDDAELRAAERKAESGASLDSLLARQDGAESGGAENATGSAREPRSPRDDRRRRAVDEVTRKTHGVPLKLIMLFYRSI